MLDHKKGIEDTLDHTQNQERPLHIRVLSDEFSRRKMKNPKYSLRAFSKFLKIAPTPLSEILSGKRDISLKIANRIILAMKLDHTDKHQFLRSVAESKQNRGLSRIDNRLRRILTTNSCLYENRKSIGFDEFQVIAEWYHLALIEMTRLDDFRLDIPWIADRLNLAEQVIADAIDRLVKLNLLRVENGQILAQAPHYETIDKKRTSEAHRRHQIQLLEKSEKSVEETPFEQRVHSSICFAIDPQRIPNARLLCEEFLDRMSDLLERNTPKKEVYEFQISLFPITRLSMEKKT